MESRQVKILVVDDEPHVAQVIARYLTQEGYQCQTAPNGEEALRMLEANTFHLVIADIMMPGMSGIDLLQMIQSVFPDVAVLIVTAVDDRETGVLAIELGAYGYVIKPFERNEIIINVANAIERRRLALLSREGSSIRSATTRPAIVKRNPIKVAPQKVLELIDSGMDESALMAELGISAKALGSLMDQLVAAGLLRQADVDGRNSLSHNTVVIERDHLENPPLNKEKPLISAQDAAQCIRTGMTDSELMKRYAISAKGLGSLFRKLVASGIVEQSDLDKRICETHQWAVLDS